MGELDELSALAYRVASYGLPPVDRAPLVIQDTNWKPVALLISARRLTGIALRAAEAKWLQVPDGALDDLIDRHREQMMFSLALERSMFAIGDAFVAADIDFIVLKGPAIAHTAYPDPSWRPFGDLDLLVRQSDWRSACRILGDSGFRRVLPEPVTGFDERFGKAATHTGPDGLQLDLHRTLVLGPFGLWVNPGTLFDHTTQFVVGGRSFHRLDDTTRVLHAAIHASLGAAPPLPLTLRDVGQVVMSSAVEWEELRDLMAAWRLAAVVQHSFSAVEQMLEAELPPDAAFVRQLRPPALERRALRGYEPNRRGRGGMALTTTLAIPTVSGKLAYLRALLFPSRDFLRARAGQGARGARASYVARWKIPVRWLTKRRK